MRQMPLPPTITQTQVYFTLLARNLAPRSSGSASSALLAPQRIVGLDESVADGGSRVDSWDSWLHTSALGWIGGGYLLQKLLAEVQQPQLGVGLQTPQCVGVADARIKQPPCQRRPRASCTSLHHIVGPQLVYSGRRDPC